MAPSENGCHLVAQIRDNETCCRYLSRQVPFPVINSPNSLDRDVESSDLARSFLTRLILAPLSRARSSRAEDLSTRFRATICSPRSASENRAIAQFRAKLLARSYARAFFSCVIKSRETEKNINLRVVIVGRRETRFLLRGKREKWKIESSKGKHSEEKRTSVVDFSRSFVLETGYVIKECAGLIYASI